MLQKLEAYLADSDGETADYLTAHAPALRAALGADRFAGIRKAVEEYDFGDALDRLRGAAGDAKVTPWQTRSISPRSNRY